MMTTKRQIRLRYDIGDAVSSTLGEGKVVARDGRIVRVQVGNGFYHMDQRGNYVPVAALKPSKSLPQSLYEAFAASAAKDFPGCKVETWDEIKDHAMGRQMRAVARRARKELEL